MTRSRFPLIYLGALLFGTRRQATLFPRPSQIVSNENSSLGWLQTNKRPTDARLCNFKQSNGTDNKVHSAYNLRTKPEATIRGIFGSTAVVKIQIDSRPRKIDRPKREIQGEREFSKRSAENNCIEDHAETRSRFVCLPRARISQPLCLAVARATFAKSNGQNCETA